MAGLAVLLKFRLQGKTNVLKIFYNFDSGGRRPFNNALKNNGMEMTDIMKLAYLTLAMAVIALILSVYNLKRVAKSEGKSEDTNRNTIGVIAILSSCQVLNRIDGRTPTMLDYVIIVCAVLVLIIIGYSAWISYRTDKG